MPDRRDTLGSYIRRTRSARQVTLRKLAAAVGVTPSYLSDIENDRRVPSEEVLERIARELDLDLDELMALRGKLDDATEEYLKRSPAAVRLFRRIAQQELNEAQLAELERQAANLGRRKKER
ncbi:MAG: helix-turn-helix transcriptional regulator [Armatimonadota bacterium]|nr:helix-turn-helix domain-containing protein [Armatimonadota bacterium]MDW8156247.1 helix-turn-helix transcriptional regulator [Armatimonadota bacterium]